MARLRQGIITLARQPSQIVIRPSMFLVFVIRWQYQRETSYTFALAPLKSPKSSETLIRLFVYPSRNLQ